MSGLVYLVGAGWLLLGSQRLVFLTGGKILGLVALWVGVRSSHVLLG